MSDPPRRSARVASKAASEAASKAASKTAAKTAAKTASKTASKSASKTASKTAAKTAANRVFKNSVVDVAAVAVSHKAKKSNMQASLTYESLEDLKKSAENTRTRLAGIQADAAQAKRDIVALQDKLKAKHALIEELQQTEHHVNLFLEETLRRIRSKEQEVKKKELLAIQEKYMKEMQKVRRQIQEIDARLGLTPMLSPRELTQKEIDDLLGDKTSDNRLQVVASSKSLPQKSKVTYDNSDESDDANELESAASAASSSSSSSSSSSVNADQDINSDLQLWSEGKKWLFDWTKFEMADLKWKTSFEISRRLFETVERKTFKDSVFPHLSSVIQIHIATKYWQYYKLCREDVRLNEEFALAMIRKHGPGIIEYIDERLRGNQDFATKAVQINGLVLKHLLEKAIDYEVVRLAVENNGLALKYANEIAKTTTSIVKTALAQNPMALQFAAALQRNNFDTVKIAVEKNGHAIQFASDSLKRNVDIVTLAMRTSPEAVKYLPETPTSDKQISQSRSVSPYTNNEGLDFLSSVAASAVAASAKNNTMSKSSATKPKKKRKAGSAPFQWQLGVESVYGKEIWKQIHEMSRDENGSACPACSKWNGAKHTKTPQCLAAQAKAQDLREKWKEKVAKQKFDEQQAKKRKLASAKKKVTFEHSKAV